MIDFAKANKNAMAYFKAVEHRAKLSGLLIGRVEVGTVDLKGALEACTRVLNPVDITPGHGHGFVAASGCVHRRTGTVQPRTGV